MGQFLIYRARTVYTHRTDSERTMRSNSLNWTRSVLDLNFGLYFLLNYSWIYALVISLSIIISCILPEEDMWF